MVTELDRSRIGLSFTCGQIQDLDGDTEGVDPKERLCQLFSRWEYIGDGLHADVYDSEYSRQTFVLAEGLINPDGTLPEKVEELFIEGDSYEYGDVTMRIAKNGDYTCVVDEDEPKRIIGNLVQERFRLDQICFSREERAGIIFDDGMLGPIGQIYRIISIPTQDAMQNMRPIGEYDLPTVMDFKRMNQTAVDYTSPVL